QKSGKFPQLSEPYEGFHGMNFCEEFGPVALAMRMRKEGLRDFGACLPAQSAFQLLQGVETLSMRMDRHVANTEALVSYLDAHDGVDSVNHPMLSQHPDHSLATDLLPRGCGAVFSFELKGGRRAGEAFIDALQIFSHLANVGDARSLVIHPASTTHSRMSDDDLLTVGIGPGLVRLSVGLEDSKDLIGDLSAALKSADKAVKKATQS
ncbi:MAG: PLP-dependent transferase, partial [Granulosicoccaceae bacterium]